ncbi:MAG: hypothetical protein U9N53_12180, partial [Bacteroidota bacterium]|nr:hypothetical protein [Bacteroidota bacterium]
MRISNCFRFVFGKVLCCVNKNLKLIPVISLIFILPAFTSFSQGVDDEKDLISDSTEVLNVDFYQNWELFDDDNPLALSLAFNTRTFKKEKYEAEKMPAVLSVHLKDTIIKKDIKIKARGEFRRGYCQFPPIKLNLKKTDFTSEYMEDQTTLKFVTHCKNYKLFESYILQEYLIYKMYNILTDMSFQVRLVQMEYIDTQEKDKPFVKYGFIIEHINSVAERNNSLRIKSEKLAQNLMDKNMMALVALFEFMIGNTDWSVTGLHNMKIIKSKDFTKHEPFPVPYDFDYSGMVNARYAIPSEILEIESVRERKYWGVCLPEENIMNAKAIFLSRKNSLYKLVQEFPYLEKSPKREMVDYLDSFYRILDSDYLFKREIISGCDEAR